MSSCGVSNESSAHLVWHITYEVLESNVLNNVRSCCNVELVIDTCSGDIDATYWTFSLKNLPLIVSSLILAGNTINTAKFSFSADVHQTFRIWGVVGIRAKVPCGIGLVEWHNILFLQGAGPASKTLSLYEFDIVWCGSAVGYREPFRSQIFAIVFGSSNKVVVDCVKFKRTKVCCVVSNIAIDKQLIDWFKLVSIWHRSFVCNRLPFS